MPAIDTLRASLEALSITVDAASVRIAGVPVVSYPGGMRPSSTVKLSGNGVHGFGEHVGWTGDAHVAFRDTVRDLPCGSFTLGDWTSRLREMDAYDRAALEAAAIDLALKQHNTNLFELAGREPRPVRYVASFARVDDPVAEATSLGPSGIELKVDADPSWHDDVYRGLAELGRVAVLDFKQQGSTEDHERAARLVPSAWIEDPGAPGTVRASALAGRVSIDMAMTGGIALASMVPRPAAINVKAPRIGSVLDAIELLDRCRMSGIAAYIGGMFEVGVGREQSLTLAALACPDGPNDIAPLIGETPRPPRLVADAERIGFGA